MLDFNCGLLLHDDCATAFLHVDDKIFCMGGTALPVLKFWSRFVFEMLHRNGIAYFEIYEGRILAGLTAILTSSFSVAIS